MLLYGSLNTSEGAAIVEFGPTTQSAGFIAITQQYYYEVELFNNSDRLPDGDPLVAPIERIRLTGLYSDAGVTLRSPTFQNMPSGWNSYSQSRRIDSAAKLWEMTIGTTLIDPETQDQRIMPGESIVFRLFFSVPAPFSLNDIVYGDIQALTFTSVDGLLTPLEPSVFLGPVGVIPEPSSFLLFAVGFVSLAVLYLSRRNPCEKNRPNRPVHLIPVPGTSGILPAEQRAGSDAGSKQR